MNKLCVSLMDEDTLLDLREAYNNSIPYGINQPFKMMCDDYRIPEDDREVIWQFFEKEDELIEEIPDEESLEFARGDRINDERKDDSLFEEAQRLARLVVE